MFDIKTMTPQMLGRMCQDGYARVKPYREEGQSAIERILGRRFFGKDISGPITAEGAPNPKAEPINLSLQQVQTIMHQVATPAGKAGIVAEYADDQPLAQQLSTLADRQAMKLNLDDVYADILFDAIARGVGISQVLLVSSWQKANVKDNVNDEGDEVEEYISFDDYAPDPFAKRRRDSRIQCVRKQFSISSALENKLFGRDPGEERLNDHLATRQEAAEILQNIDRLEIRKDSGERVSDLSQPDAEREDDKDSDLAELWEIEVRAGDGWYTFVLPSRQDADRPFENATKFLYCERSVTPEEGSLDFLTLTYGPDQILPPSLASQQMDLAVFADALAIKAVASALSWKRQGVYRAGGNDLAKKLAQGKSFGWFEGDPSTVNIYDSGGGIENVIPGMEFILQRWENTSGGMQMAAGQATKDKTATAFQGRMGQVQGTIQHYQKRIEDFASRRLRARMLLTLSNPNFRPVVPVTVGTDPMTGMNIVIPVPLRMEYLEGKYLDFNYRVKASSTLAVDPVMQGNLIVQALSVLPNALQLEMSGAMKPGFAAMVLRKLGVSEVDQMIEDFRYRQTQMMIRMQSAGAESPGAGPANAMDARRSAMAPAVPGMGGMPMDMQGVTA